MSTKKEALKKKKIMVQKPVAQVSVQVNPATNRMMASNNATLKKDERPELVFHFGIFLGT